MKKIIFSLIAALVIGTSAFAQVKDFRANGYKGNFSITDQLGVWTGIETSHGYMFNRHHYLGAGVGVYMFPNGRNYPTFANVFLDYQYYIKDAKNTPVLGLKTGLFKTINSNTDGWKFKQAVYVEPNIGWSWGLKSGNAFSTTLGAALYKPIGNDSGHPVVVMPKIGFSFEF